MSTAVEAAATASCTLTDGPLPLLPAPTRRVCEHAVAFVKTAGVRSVPIVRDVAFVAMHPSLQRAADASTTSTATSTATVVAAGKCFSCSSFCTRLAACLHCVYFGCFRHRHLHEHGARKQHPLCLDVRRFEIYCLVCEDVVYNEQLELAMSKPRLGERAIAAPTTLESDALMNSFKRVFNSNGYLGLRGMYNLGSTCFMGVVLQSLINNPLLRDYFLADFHNVNACTRKRLSTRKNCLACDMDNVFQMAFSGETSPFAPHQLLCSMWSHADHLAGYEQRDAHEFLIALLDGIHSSISDALRDCPCIIHRAFSGELQSNVTCLQCQSVSTAIDPIFDISLDLDNSHGHVRLKSLQNPNGEILPQTLANCLERFTHPETLSDKFFCRTCNSSQESVKQFSFRTLPRVMSIHIKRFKHHGSSHSKVDTYMQFPIYGLDMSKFVSATPKGEKVDMSDEDVLPTPSCIYNLCAVVEHSGTLQQGHYISYVRRGPNWFRCDDAVVRKASEREVLQSRSYMLFYMQCKS